MCVCEFVCVCERDQVWNKVLLYLTTTGFNAMCQKCAYPITSEAVLLPSAAAVTEENKVAKREKTGETLRDELC